MMCPVCEAPTSKVLRTRPDRQAHSVGRTRQCKNPECGAIFLTHDTVLYVIDGGRLPADVADLARKLSSLGGDALEQLRVMVANL